MLSLCRSKIAALFGAPIAIALFAACLDAEVAAGTPIGGSGVYEDRVEEISSGVLTLQAGVTAHMDEAVTMLGDAPVPAEHSLVLINVNREARQLSADAQTAMFRLSALGPPDRCRQFHRKHSEALLLLSQMGFEYALATDSAVPGETPQIKLEPLYRGDDYRAEARAAMDEAEELLEECAV